MKSHDSCATIGFTTNHRDTEKNMGRKHLTLKQHCRGSHFTWAERLKLQYYWTGSNGYRKIRSHTLLGKIFQNSLKTIKRELQRGMVEHVLSDIPFIRIEYNADHAQLDAENRMWARGHNRNQAGTMPW